MFQEKACLSPAALSSHLSNASLETPHGALHPESSLASLSSASITVLIIRTKITPPSFHHPHKRYRSKDSAAGRDALGNGKDGEAGRRDFTGSRILCLQGPGTYGKGFRIEQGGAGTSRKCRAILSSTWILPVLHREPPLCFPGSALVSLGHPHLFIFASCSRPTTAPRKS